MFFSVLVQRRVQTHPDIVLSSEYRTYQKSFFMNRLRCISLFFTLLYCTSKKIFENLPFEHTQYQSPLPDGKTTVSPKFWKGGGGGQKRKLPGRRDLKSSCHGYLSGWAYYVSSQKKTFKNKIWVWGLNFKWWSWPVLPKQPINV